MENLPESLYVDPIDASTYCTAPPFATARAESSAAAAERANIQQLINLLRQPHHREQAITELNKLKGNNEIALLLWNSADIAFILLQEFLGVYRLLSPPQLGAKESARVCSALALLQCIASHPETRMELIKAKIPVYIYPFMNTTEPAEPERIKCYDYLRLTSLGVIGALVKSEDSNTPDIVHFLLETEMVPLCLRCMDVGSSLAKTVAAFIISKILAQQEGQLYCGLFAERFYAVAKSLNQVVEQYAVRPPQQLLKHVLMCYMRLSEVSRACDALSHCYPARLRSPAYLDLVCDNTNRGLADQVLRNIIVGPPRAEEPAGLGASSSSVRR